MKEKSISELGNWKWKGNIPTLNNGGGTETRFYELHKVPLKNLDDSDIRFLIGQNECLEYLVPLALEKLKNNIFIESEYYEGDLLCALFEINDSKDFWYCNPILKNELINLYNDQKKNMGIIDMLDSTKIKIKTLYNDFINK